MLDRKWTVFNDKIYYDRTIVSSFSCGISPLKLRTLRAIDYFVEKKTNLSVIKMLKSFECVWLHEHFGLYQEWISIKKPRSSISRTFRYFNQKQNFGKFLRNFHFQICSFLDSDSFGVGFDYCWWWVGKFTNFIFAKLGFRYIWFLPNSVFSSN